MKGGNTATEETEQTWIERRQQRHQAITNIRFGGYRWMKELDRNIFSKKIQC